MTTRPCLSSTLLFVFFFFNDTATTEIYTLSLHDALPISKPMRPTAAAAADARMKAIQSATVGCVRQNRRCTSQARSEEHTSELQSRQYLVCRLLLEKKNILFTTVRSEPTPSDCVRPLRYI